MSYSYRRSVYSLNVKGEVTEWLMVPLSKFAARCPDECFQIQNSVFPSINQIGVLYLACRFVPGRAKRLVSKMLAKILV